MHTGSAIMRLRRLIMASVVVARADTDANRTRLDAIHAASYRLAVAVAPTHAPAPTDHTGHHTSTCSDRTIATGPATGSATVEYCWDCDTYFDWKVC
jgi:hypothetical protein